MSKYLFLDKKGLFCFEEKNLDNFIQNVRGGSLSRLLHNHLIRFGNIA